MQNRGKMVQSEQRNFEQIPVMVKGREEVKK